ncbi:MAG: Gfo/Idh/MocA family oxidoreductase [Elusimicrobia bacterium]|nr:Gfo/Idh/MocA family oxidoreductase [Elusimicrobiota bacterium]
MKVKIIGAGSIGNHLAQAARRMGWSVAIVDADPKALDRTKNDIYPKRYGSWDDAIKLFKSGAEPAGGFDLIMIGTPPDTHMKIALRAIEENPRLLHIEKPLCTPDLAGIEDFEKLLKRHPGTIVTVGYDHSISDSIEAMLKLAKDGFVGAIQTIDVEFREHWKGIFGAHPWLAGPGDSYLGYWKRGGGAGGEHSHALHLWEFLSVSLGWGAAQETQAMLDIRRINGAEYDQIAAFSLKSEKGGMGRVIQDVVTIPARKWAKLQGDKGFIEWFCNGVPEGDLVRYQQEGKSPMEKIFPKKRPDDFYREMLHYEALLDGSIKPKDSPLKFTHGLSIMKILKQSYHA